MEDNSFKIKLKVVAVLKSTKMIRKLKIAPLSTVVLSIPFKNVGRSLTHGFSYAVKVNIESYDSDGNKTVWPNALNFNWIIDWCYEHLEWIDKDKWLCIK